MPEEIVMVSSCPLCAGPEEVPSMVVVEIDRIIPKGRAAIMICRSCAGAVIRAAERVEPELAEITSWFDRMKAQTLVANEFTEVFPCPANCDLEKSGVPHFHTEKQSKEPGDDPSTD